MAVYATPAAATVSFCLFSAGALGAALHAVQRLKETNETRRRTAIFSSTLALSLVLRMVWVALVSGESEEYYHTAARPSYALNRVALALTFTSFSFVTAFWANVLNVTFHKAERRPFGLFRSTSMFFATNVAMYLATVLLLVVRLGVNDWKGYNAEIECVAFLFLVLSAFFLYFGSKLVRSLPKTASGTRSVQARRVLFSAVACTIAFLLRFIVLLYHPLTGKDFPEPFGYILYPYFFYEVPELVPAAALLLMMRGHSAGGALRDSSSLGGLMSLSVDADTSPALSMPLLIDGDDFGPPVKTVSSGALSTTSYTDEYDRMLEDYEEEGQLPA
eukprot:PLAT4727.1.p1 GENE.PLAT4727.1~~PLAT4727.1.p1  ORF type:complete len:342 (+),score=134.52 PLAT4727.1:31-1026(+)